MIYKINNYWKVQVADIFNSYLVVSDAAVKWTVTQLFDNEVEYAAWMIINATNAFCFCDSNYSRYIFYKILIVNFIYDKKKINLLSNYYYLRILLSRLSIILRL